MSIRGDPSALVGAFKRVPGSITAGATAQRIAVADPRRVGLYLSVPVTAPGQVLVSPAQNDTDVFGVELALNEHEALTYRDFGELMQGEWWVREVTGFPSVISWIELLYDPRLLDRG